MHAIFEKNQKKGKTRAKEGKVFENLGKNVQNLKSLKQLEYALYCSNKNCQGGRCVRE